MASFKDYVRYEKAFMCYGGEVKCPICKMSRYNNGKEMLCGEFRCNYPDEAEKIIDNWCEEHPLKTRKDEFLKMFPDTKLFKAGVPVICPKNLVKYNCHSEGCSDCKKKFWLEEIE